MRPLLQILAVPLMKLFEPDAAESFVFAVVPMAAKEGVQPDYKCIRAGDMNRPEPDGWPRAACCAVLHGPL